MSGYFVCMGNVAADYKRWWEESNSKVKCKNEYIDLKTMKK